MHQSIPAEGGGGGSWGQLELTDELEERNVKGDLMSLSLKNFITINNLEENEYNEQIKGET